MNPRLVLYLTARQMTASRWIDGQHRSDGTFANDEAGHRQFAAYLRQHPTAVYRLLVNIADEHFRIETLPRLSRRDRQTVIARKLRQNFRAARLSTSLSLGHEKTARKDERVLLAALDNPSLLTPWLRAMETTEIALAGIYSLPFLAPTLLSSLSISERHCLVLTQQDHSLRQSYLDNGQVHFSRLTPLPDPSDDEAIVAAFFREATELHQYLCRQRIIERTQSLSAHIVVRPQLGSRLRALGAGDLVGSCHFVVHELNDCTRTRPFISPTPLRDEESLFLHLVACTPPLIQFADASLRHTFQLRALRRLLTGTGAMIWLVGLSLCAVLQFKALSLRQETGQLQEAAALARERHAQIVGSFPALPLGNSALRCIVDQYTGFERRSPSPLALYLSISRALDTVPGIELDRIEWTNVALHDEDPAVRRDRGSAKPLADRQVATLHGTVRPEHGATPRQVLQVFELFASALRTDSALQVDVQSQPFDIDPGKTYKNEDARNDKLPARPFALQIARRIDT